jgi:predicted MFS family arabinose efflux permease
LDDTNRNNRLLTYVAMFSAMLMIAHHIAGKATRDALFLTAFDVSQLPVMMMVSAAISVAAVLGMSRLLARFGPARVMPPLYFTSALLLVLQWALAGSRPQVAAVVLYLQISALNSILISGFWSVINERFDPYEAKKVITRLTAATSLGGLVGGVSASVMASVADTNAILLMLAAMHLFCAAAVYYIGRGQRHAPQAEARVSHMFAPLKRNPLIRRMAVLALLVATTAAVLDYILKSEAATNLSDEQLITFFSWFYMAVGLGTFLVQSAVGNKALRWLGLGGTMAAWPLAIMVTGAGALVLRSLVTATLMRASANLLYNSFFRSGFELLYTPISPADKRTGKVLIDVGADRSGDMVGGFLVMGILLVPVATESLLIVTAMLLAAICLLLIFALHRGYVRQLADNLRTGQMQADDIEAVDATTIHTLALTQTALKRDSLLSEIAASRANGDSPRGAGRAAGTPRGLDPVTEAIVDLRSGDETRIRRTLASRAMSPELIPHAIALLGNEHVLRDTLKAMRTSASAAAGQLCDNLLSSAQSPLIRRRLPLLLAHSDSPIAVQGLTTALDDTDWNVRFRCARALETISKRHPDLRPDEDQVLRIVEREAEDIASEGITLSGNDSGQSGRITLLFHLFGAIYEPEPMELSLQALQSDDRALQGTALEYLENRLPAHIWKLLQPSLSGAPKAAGPKRSLQQSARDLVRAASSLRSTKKPAHDDTAHELD